MPQLSIRDALAESPVRLAPMASFTNAPFRQIARACGSGFTTNEEIDVDALLYDNVRTRDLARIRPEEGLVAMQLLGSSAETLVPAAVKLVDSGAQIIDINMGCPVRKIVAKGKGAALMRDIPVTAAILSAIRRAVDVPLTIKIRGGWDRDALNAVEVARMAEDVGVDAIAVHPRTRSQQFTGRAPWQVIAGVVAAVDIPVTGNGDVSSIAEADAMMAQTGCDSVMVGRAALGRPWLFDDCYDQLDDEARAKYERRVIDEHLDLIEADQPPAEALIQAKKQLAQYVANTTHARAARRMIFEQSAIDDVRTAFNRFHVQRREVVAV